MCTKSTTVDEKIPDVTSGGLKVHTTVSSLRKASDPDFEAGGPLTKSQSKKIIEKKKVQAQLDGVQKQREMQQQQGVQRLHERSHSMKLQRANSKKGDEFGRTPSTNSTRSDKVKNLNEKLGMGASMQTDADKKDVLLFSVGP